jgi:oligopeptide transport system permease protein
MEANSIYLPLIKNTLSELWGEGGKEVLRYTLGRFYYMIIALWVVISITFVLMQALPGDPFTSDKLTPQAHANLLKYYGLDQPLWKQYLIYLKNIGTLDLGNSMFYKTQSVMRMIKEGFPYSAVIGLEAEVFGLTTGIAFGIVAALNRNGFWDGFTMLVAILGVSIPGFVVASLLQFYIGRVLRWLPVVSTHMNGIAPTILPSFALGIGALAGTARMMRTQMLEVLSQDYIRTAKAKGLTKFAVIVRHGIRNAILPIITNLGPNLAAVVTGTFVIETIFGIPGLGKYYVSAIANQDYPLIMGTTVFYAALLVVMIFLVDVAYGWIDPRIRVTGGSKE